MIFKLELSNRNISDEDLKADVLRVTRLVAPLPLSSKKYDELGIYSSDTVSRRFGERSWNKALKFLGLEPAQVFHTEQELYDNIAKVWIAKMAQPTRRDMDTSTASSISSSAYLRKFGRWNIALEKFIEYIDGNIVDTTKQTSFREVKHKTKREPSNRLKVQVLMRDGNRCSICGVKCDQGIHKIHFDHRKPWSEGGETTLENLRVLCKACNEALGNSNK